VRTLIDPLVHFMENTDEIASDWAKRDPATIKQVNSMLEKAGFDEETIVAQTIRAELPILETMDNMIARAEARGHVILREFNRRRETIERRLRSISERIEDAEFEELPSPASEE
jgi:phosphopantothenate synthetase